MVGQAASTAAVAYLFANIMWLSPVRGWTCRSLRNQRIQGRRATLLSQATAAADNLPRLYVGPLPDKPTVLKALDHLGSSEPLLQQQTTPPPPLQQLTPGAMVHLSGEQSHYVTTVLRLGRKGASPLLRLFNGEEEWVAELVTDTLATKQRRRRQAVSEVAAVCQTKLRTAVPKDQGHDCWLWLAPPKKKERLKWLVEKTTELNVAGYLLLETDFSETALHQQVTHAKLQAYSVEASEQCERLTLPPFCTLLTPTTDTGGVTATVDDENMQQLLQHNGKARPVSEDATTKLAEVLHAWSSLPPDPTQTITLLVCRERSNALPVWQALEQIYNNSATTTTATTITCFLIGPEGGWSLAEEQLMDQLEVETQQRDHHYPNKIYNVSLGPNILRAETAAVTAASAFALHQDFTNRQQQGP